MGEGVFGFAERKWFPPCPSLLCSLMRLQGGMRRGLDTEWVTFPQFFTRGTELQTPPTFPCQYRSHGA